MSESKQATHIAIPVEIYGKFLEAIKSEKGLTPESLANVILTAKPIVIENQEPELTETIFE
jgi:hypothetical protein